MRKIIGAAVLAAFLCCGCRLEKEDDTMVRELDYTIVRVEEVPEQLMKVIQSKKEQLFRLTYQEEGALYIAAGYGKQTSGGYSIQVQNLYLTSNAIYFKTQLQGPKKEDADEQIQSYPYIVVRTEHRDESVVFQ